MLKCEYVRKRLYTFPYQQNFHNYANHDDLFKKVRNRIHCFSSLLPHSNLLITGLISDHVVTICHFFPSERFLFKNSFIMQVLYKYKVCFSLNMLVVDIYWLLKTHCDILLSYASLLFCLFCLLVIQCSCHWSQLQITYLLTYLLT